MQPMTLVQLRESRGLSRTAVARACRTSASLVYRWEWGEFAPGYDNMRGLCGVYGVSMDELSQVIEWTRQEAERAYVRESIDHTCGDPRCTDPEHLAVVEEEPP